MSKAENLGEVMRGDKIENSLYEIKMKVEESCKTLCKRAYTRSDMNQFKSKVLPPDAGLNEGACTWHTRGHTPVGARVAI